jgi:pilus assembly protein CpaF
MTPVATLAEPNAADVRNVNYLELKSRIHQDLLNRLNLERLSEIKREEGEPEIRALIVGMLDREYRGVPLSLVERESVIGDVLNELFGLGPLERLLGDSEISDILVNRFDRVYIERNGRLEEAEDITFKDDRHLRRIIERIVSSVGRRIDESNPMVDARLQDGSRVNAIIPPLALDGSALSIRRFRTDRLGHQDLVARESLTQPMLDFLKGAIACRLNVIVSGGTGAGKTTLLNVLSGFISEHERIISIEDAAELLLRQRHVVRLETRPSNIEGKGSVRQRELMINALRMRPDRIIVGEVRGEEALDMLQAMNTGHDGSLTTIHANSPRDALYRLNTMVAMANLNIPDKAVRQQIASALNLVIQISRLSDGTRKVTSISEVTGMEGEVITMQEIFLFEKTGIARDGKAIGQFRATGIRPKCSDRLAASGVDLPMEMFEHIRLVNAEHTRPTSVGASRW